MPLLFRPQKRLEDNVGNLLTILAGMDSERFASGGKACCVDGRGQILFEFQL